MIEFRIIAVRSFAHIPSIHGVLILTVIFVRDDARDEPGLELHAFRLILQIFTVILVRDDAWDESSFEPFPLRLILLILTVIFVGDNAGDKSDFEVASLAISRFGRSI